MMKMMIPSIFITLFMYKLYFMILLLSLMILIMFTMSFNNYMMIINQMCYLDNLSFMMILLTLMSSILIILSTNIMKETMFMISMISITLMFLFSSYNIIHFYILFELVLIPTMILITSLGNQPERLQAGIYLFMYTITASLPLLISILLMKNNMSFLMSYMYMYKFKFILFMVMAFLIKMPMYFTHLWLPKAHVEAPLEGSMILAAVLLKLGGYGLLRFIPMCIQKINIINYWIISISILGATMTGLNCVRQKDLKSLIAYSSVAHMGLTLTGIFVINKIGFSGAIMMMIAHGLSSSALFLLVNDLYMKMHTRNIIVFKGLMLITPNIIFWWFMFTAVNISAPPSINTISEIFIMSGMMMWSKSLLIPIILASLMAASFSLSLFINISHNKNEMMYFNPTSQKIFLSLFLHLIPLILILMKMECMYMYMYSLNKTMICGIINSSMMKYMLNLMMMFIIPLISSIYMLYNNMFISMEIPMINMYSFNIQISLLLDWISLMFLSTVMFVSSMIIIFSMYYIPKSEHNQFCLLLLMFVLSMSILIMSDNIIFILLGWDGLGLSSYVLVIYYQNYSSAASGSITLMSNRIGDIMILLSISIMMMNSNWNFNMNKEYNMYCLLLLLIAASSKSAQFPFSAWLPAAMAAPTPISALVHSSTLVTAGVFLTIRIMNNIHPLCMLMMMISSSATAIYAGMAANWEQDMKKIIALSTLSQIAMMLFAISMKSSMLAFFHLITHALFKSTMFLCAGIMIHNSSYQDMRMMGLNYSNSPITSSILGVSSLALMGIPFMSGFFSKDMIIDLMIKSKLYSMLASLMLISIGLTAMYTIRMSMFSNYFSTKSKTDMNMHNDNKANTPLSMMAPSSIMMGTIMLWMMCPEQMFLFPQNFKMIIIIMLMLGATLGVAMMYKSKSFINLGESSISLWFTHFLTVYLMKMSSPLMITATNNDKMWQELYGPKNMFSLMKLSSSTPDILKMSLLFILIMLLITPYILS